MRASDDFSPCPGSHTNGAVQENFLSFGILTTNRPGNGFSAFTISGTVLNSARPLLKSQYIFDRFSQAVSETLLCKQGPLNLLPHTLSKLPFQQLQHYFQFQLKGCVFQNKA